MNNFTNKNVIITGSSRGIGKDIAINFYNCNANIFLLSRNKNNLEKLQNALEIIKIRSEEMQNSEDTNPGAMIAIIGATENQIEDICNQEGIIVAANYNSNQQIVLSGDINAINLGVEFAKSIGIKKLYFFRFPHFFCFG